MIKAVIFDFFGVLFLDGKNPNRPLLNYIKNELRPKYKIGILSNAAIDYAKEKFDQHDYALFDDILPSFAYGMPKPETGIYKLAAKRLDVKPGECVFIDDTSGHCQGAEAAGMKAILYKDLISFKNNLKELLAAGADD